MKKIRQIVKKELNFKIDRVQRMDETCPDIKMVSF